MDTQEKKQIIQDMLNDLEKVISEKFKRLDNTKKNTKKLISIIIPAYNEGDNIFEMTKNIIPILESFSYKSKDYYLRNLYDYEIIYVNDGSKDETWNSITEVSKKNKKIKGVNFSRNFGKEIALTAGLEYSSGDIAITLDADGQHPISKIPEFIKKWEAGFDIVYNVRPKIKGATFFKKISSKLFYLIYNNLANEKMEEGITDYRLLDRKVINEYLKFNEKNRIYRGIVDYIGFTKTSLTFDALERLDGGDARYSFGKLLKLSIDALTSFSVKPLKLVLIFGLLIIFGVISIYFFILFDNFIFHIFIYNFYLTSIILLNITLLGIVLTSLGLIGIYIGNIHEEVKGRPLFIVKENINLENK